MRDKVRSFRLSADEVALLEAAAAGFSVNYGVRFTRSDVIRRGLRKLTPPDAPGPEFAAWRSAYRKVFGS